uniref:Uncharacterized protein n=1 Tax=Candidatus Kentrum sp. LPFa TaxID=2126335 RepID=A0A450XCR2_9GAMM|nr:MAG: hypothetical protein BECKLPF1236A_GA0070988_1004214 [Candidatus Kentron sp. LPFa]VFK27085.1 MAG: hypothetical protein BECKLPF1236C_GA0070990_1004213 [Candidatus Kentron sp. LPFa]
MRVAIHPTAPNRGCCFIVKSLQMDQNFHRPVILRCARNLFVLVKRRTHSSPYGRDDNAFFRDGILVPAKPG